LPRDESKREVEAFIKAFGKGSSLRRKRHWWGRQGKKLSRNDIQNT
jgi:hypothetical protein